MNVSDRDFLNVTKAWPDHKRKREILDLVETERVKGIQKERGSRRAWKQSLQITLVTEGGSQIDQELRVKPTHGQLNKT